MTDLYVQDDAPAPSAAAEQNVPWGWADVGRTLVFVVIGLLLLIVLAVVAILVAGGGDRPGILALFAIGSGFYGLLMLGVYRYTVRRYAASWAALGLRPAARRWLALVPLLWVVQIAGMALINVQIGTLMGGQFENPQLETFSGLRMTPADLVLLLLLLAVITPIAEELFFRGMLYPLLRRRTSVPAAVMLNAAIFALAHFIPLLIPALFFVGLILAWVRERSRSILPGIGMHALQNGLFVVAIYVASASGA